MPFYLLSTQQSKANVSQRHYGNEQSDLFFPFPLHINKMKKQHHLVSSKTVHLETQNSRGNQEAKVNPY
jgi:hypothetical protein